MPEEREQARSVLERAYTDAIEQADDVDETRARLFDDVSGAETTADHIAAGQLRREQSSGTIAADLDTDLVVELVVRISASFLTVPGRIVDIADEAQLDSVAGQFLVPMLEQPR